MKKRGHRGFTLIELLVVIAIIGILSAVVLASLTTARNRSMDAAVKAQLKLIQSQAALYFNNTGNGSYAGTGTGCHCDIIAGAKNAEWGSILGLFQDTTIVSQMINLSSISGGTPYLDYIPTAWAAWAPLKSNPNQWWCIDSTGSVGVVTTNPIPTNPAYTTVCPAS